MGPGKSHTLAFVEFAESVVRGKLGSETDWVFGVGWDGLIAFRYSSSWRYVSAALLTASHPISSVSHASSSSSDSHWGNSNLDSADIWLHSRWIRACNLNRLFEKVVRPPSKGRSHWATGRNGSLFDRRWRGRQSVQCSAFVESLNKMSVQNRSVPITHWQVIKLLLKMFSWQLMHSMTWFFWALKWNLQSAMKHAGCRIADDASNKSDTMSGGRILLVLWKVEVCSKKIGVAILEFVDIRLVFLWCWVEQVERCLVTLGVTRAGRSDPKVL